MEQRYWVAVHQDDEYGEQISEDVLTEALLDGLRRKDFMSIDVIEVEEEQ